MNIRLEAAILTCVGLACLALADGARAAELVSIAPDPTAGMSQAVVVDRSSPLVFTEQLLSRDPEDRSADDPDQQIRMLFERLDRTLSAAGTSPDRVAKLNFYVASTELAARVRGELAKRYHNAKTLPAVSFVQTRLPNPRALVGVDAVACTDQASATKYLNEYWSDYFTARDAKKPATGEMPAARRRPFSMLLVPKAPIAFISGDAKPGDLPAATTATLESLDATLKSLPISRENVVQVKCFLQPMSRAAEVRQRIDEFFSPIPTPPVVMVEWTMKGPIEIELIAYEDRPHQPSPTGDVNYFTPPGMKPSPVFSRVTMASAPKLIYFSGLYADSAGDGAAQVSSIFDQLGKLLPQTGSDFRHLAKATYYVSDDDASNQLNVMRPKYYDPARPPAASKAPVAGVAKAGRTITLDMIAVPPIGK
jgi:enamine deaminase RidA (YjgF/YER057c/UK114 family)